MTEPSPEDRLQLKVALERAQMLDAAGTVVAKPITVKPDPAMVNRIFAKLELEPVDRIHVNKLSHIMIERDVGPWRRIQIRETLSPPGF